MAGRVPEVPAGEALECRLAMLVESLTCVLERLEAGTIADSDAERIEALAATLHDVCAQVSTGLPEH